MEKDTVKFEGYVKRVAEIVNDKGFMAMVKEELKPDGAVEYKLVFTEDPNSLCRATVSFNSIADSFEDYPPEEKYAEGILKELFERESPVRQAVKELEAKEYQEIRDRIVPCIMSKESGKEYMKNIPARDYLDFAVAYICRGEKTPITITNSIMSKLGVAEEQLFSDSVKNIVPKGPVKASQIIDNEDLNKFVDPKTGNRVDAPIYIVSDENFMYGANVMLLPDFLEKISKDLGGDYYVVTGINSAIFAIPKKENLRSIEDMKAISDETVKDFAGEFGKLPSNIYLYRSLSRKLEKVM